MDTIFRNIICKSWHSAERLPHDGFVEHDSTEAAPSSILLLSMMLASGSVMTDPDAAALNDCQSATGSVNSSSTIRQVHGLLVALLASAFWMSSMISVCAECSLV